MSNPFPQFHGGPITVIDYSQYHHQPAQAQVLQGNERGDSAASLQMNWLRLRIHRLDFKTPGKLPIILGHCCKAPSVGDATCIAKWVSWHKLTEDWSTGFSLQSHPVVYYIIFAWMSPMLFLHWPTKKAFCLHIPTYHARNCSDYHLTGQENIFLVVNGPPNYNLRCLQIRTVSVACPHLKYPVHRTRL